MRKRKASNRTLKYLALAAGRSGSKEACRKRRNEIQFEIGLDREKYKPSINRHHVKPLKLYKTG